MPKISYTSKKNCIFCCLTNYKKKTELCGHTKGWIVFQLGIILVNFSYCHGKLLADYRVKYNTKHNITLTVHKYHQQYFLVIIMPVIAKFVCE